MSIRKSFFCLVLMWWTFLFWIKLILFLKIYLHISEINIEGKVKILYLRKYSLAEFEVGILAIQRITRFWVIKTCIAVGQNPNKQIP